MNLKLAILHMDMVVGTLDLKPGEYSLGRADANDIPVRHLSLHQRQGKILYSEEQWFYEDLHSRKKVFIEDEKPIALSGQVCIATWRYIENSQKRLSDFSNPLLRYQKQKKHLAKMAGLVACLLFIIFLGYRYLGDQIGVFNERTLLHRVRNKIVEFEANRNDKAIEDFKKYAGLKDTDFKENSGFCTGFLVGTNIVLTASHCLFGSMVIDINNDFHLKTSDGKKHQIKEILGFDLKRDYLFLRTEGMESYGHLDFADSYRIEQKVYTVGNVHGEGIAIRDGIISSESTDPNEPDVRFIRYSAGTSPGNSGGPLLNAKGEVVALVFAATWTENFNLGTSSIDLKKAYQHFIEGAEQKQTVNLAIKKVLNFKPELVLQFLSCLTFPNSKNIQRSFKSLVKSTLM